MFLKGKKYNIVIYLFCSSEMPNIIINNYCNQKCSYCFANENMKDISLQKNMKLSTYLSILKYLKNIWDNNVRILGWEPIIFPDLRKYIDIAQKGGFNIIVFSNVNINPEKFKKIFLWTQNVRVNCNINDEDFYTEEEKNNIIENISFLQEQKIHTIIGYNMVNIDLEPTFPIFLARKFWIQNINLKVTNSCLWEELFLDTWSRTFWKYVYKLIKKYYTDFQIELSCGLSKNIFSETEYTFISQTAEIHIYFWCDGHRWRFDINTDGSIFKCYPLESLYKKNKITIQSLVKKNTPLQDTLNTLYAWVFSDGECTAHKSIKESSLLWLQK